MPVCSARAADLTRLPTFVYDRCSSPRQRTATSSIQRHTAGDESSLRFENRGSAVNESSVINDSRYVDVRMGNPWLAGTPTRGRWQFDRNAERQVGYQATPRSAKANDATLSESCIAREGCSIISASMSLSRNLRDMGAECDISTRSHTCSLSSQERLGYDASQQRATYSATVRYCHFSSVSPSGSPRVTPRNAGCGGRNSKGFEFEHISSKCTSQSWAGHSPSSSSRASPLPFARESSQRHPKLMSSGFCSNASNDTRPKVDSIYSGAKAFAMPLLSRSCPDVNVEKETLYSYTLQRVCSNSPRVSSLSPRSRANRSCITSNRELSTHGLAVAPCQSQSPPHTSRTNDTRSGRSLSPRSCIDCSGICAPTYPNFLPVRDDHTKQNSSSNGVFTVSPVQSLSPHSCASVSDLRHLAGLSPIRMLSVSCSTPHLEELGSGDTVDEIEHDFKRHLYPSSPTISPQKLMHEEDVRKNGSEDAPIADVLEEKCACSISDSPAEIGIVPSPATQPSIAITPANTSAHHFREASPIFESSVSHVTSNMLPRSDRLQSPTGGIDETIPKSLPCSSREHSPSRDRVEAVSSRQQSPSRDATDSASSILRCSSRQQSPTRDEDGAILNALPCSSRQHSPSRDGVEGISNMLPSRQQSSSPSPSRDRVEAISNMLPCSSRKQSPSQSPSRDRVDSPSNMLRGSSRQQSPNGGENETISNMHRFSNGQQSPKCDREESPTNMRRCGSRQQSPNPDQEETVSSVFPYTSRQQSPTRNQEQFPSNMLPCSSDHQSQSRDREELSSPATKGLPPGILARHQLSPDMDNNFRGRACDFKLPNSEETCWEILQRLHLIDDSSPLSSSESRPESPVQETNPLQSFANGIIHAPRRTPVKIVPTAKEKQRHWPKGTLSASALEEDSSEPCPVSLSVRQDFGMQRLNHQSSSITLGAATFTRIGSSDRLNGSSPTMAAADMSSNHRIELHRPPPIQTPPRSPKMPLQPSVQCPENEAVINPRTPKWSPPARWEHASALSPTQATAVSAHDKFKGATRSPHSTPKGVLSPVRGMPSPRSAVAQESNYSHTPGFAPPLSWTSSEQAECRRQDRWVPSSSSATPRKAVEGTSPSMLQWTADIDRRSGSPLGVTLNSSSLEVQSLYFGLITSWNARNPDNAVCVGDKIVEVNGIRDVQSIIDECEGSRMLHITFKRNSQQTLQSPIRSVHVTRSRPISPLRIPGETCVSQTPEQSHPPNVFGAPLGLPPRHLGASPCPDKPSLRLLSSTLAQHGHTNTDAHSTCLDASLISDSLGSTSITWRQPQLGPPVLAGIGMPTSFPSQLEYIHAHGQVGARQLAESLVQQASAEGMLLQEVDRACRLQAQREVAEWSLSLKSSQTSKTLTRDVSIHDLTSNNAQNHTSAPPSLPDIVNRPTEECSDDEDDNSDSWEGLPLPSSPSPQRKDSWLSPSHGQAQSSETRKLGVVQPATPSYFPKSPIRPIVTQPLASPKLDTTMFESLKSWAAVDGGAGVSGDFVSLVQSAVETRDLAAQVRSLRKVTRDAQKEHSKLTRCHSKFDARCSEECRKTMLARDRLAKLRRNVEDLQQDVACIQKEKETTSVVASEVTSTATPSDALREAKAHQRAQEVLFNVTFGVLQKLQIAPDPAARRNSSLIVNTTSTTELPGVTPKERRGSSRGPGWASKLPELGTPSLPKKVWDTKGDENKTGEPKIGPKIDESKDESHEQAHADSEGEKRRSLPHRQRSAMLLEEEGEDKISEDRLCTSTSDLSRLRSFIERTKTIAEQEAFNQARTSPNMQRPGRSHSDLKFRAQTTDAKSLPASSGGVQANKAVVLSPEMVELIAIVLIPLPKIMTSSPPPEVVDMMEDIKKKKDSDNPPQCDASMLTAEERARVLRYGVTVGAVAPDLLAAYLGKEHNQDIREAFCSQWVAGWLGPYLADRGDKFAATPDTQASRIFAWHSAPTQYGRQCGRVLIDGMRDLFGRAMRLTGVEQEALTRLLEEFAHVLCLEDEIQKRFRYVLVPDTERPKDVESLEHAVFLLAYNALLLNTAMHNPAAKGRAQRKEDFCKQGRTIAGFQDDFCRKMYDLIKAQPLGL